MAFFSGWELVYNQANEACEDAPYDPCALLGRNQTQAQAARRFKHRKAYVITRPSSASNAHLYTQSKCTDHGTLDKARGKCVCEDGRDGMYCQYRRTKKKTKKKKGRALHRHQERDDGDEAVGGTGTSEDLAWLASCMEESGKCEIVLE